MLMLAIALDTATTVPGGKFTKPMPIGNPGAWATNDDYPPRSKAARDEGEVRFALTIDDTGRVIRCDIEHTSGHRELDFQTCRLLFARAKFRPARAMQSQPIASVFRSRIRWALSAGFKGETLAVADVELVVARFPANVPKYLGVQAIVAADGKVEACNSHDAEFHKAFGAAICQTIQAQGLPPSLDGGGKPVRVLRQVSAKLVTF